MNAHQFFKQKRISISLATRRHHALPDNHGMNTQAQPRNPLHGLTLERMLNDLVDFYGWEELGRLIPIRSFNLDPSVASSLKFLRKTPWAREKVEALYLHTLRRYG